MVSHSSSRSNAASFIFVAAAGISLTVFLAATIVNALAERDDSSDDDSCLAVKEQKHEWVMEYHYSETSSTQDSAKQLISSWKSKDEADNASQEMPSTTTSKSVRGPFVVTAWQQTNGRGTSERHWWGAPGNTFATMCIKQDDWTATRLPLTLMPLLVGLLVAKRVEHILLFDDTYYCQPSSSFVASSPSSPLVTVKWPNDVLVNDHKIAGVLIEASDDWFLIGIGVNVAFAPVVPSSGHNRGRQATCMAEHCPGLQSKQEEANNRTAARMARQLGVDLAEDLVQWLSSTGKKRSAQEELLREWKSWFDWETELVLRDSEDGESVLPIELMPDGRLLVQKHDGTTRVMISDYFF